MRHLFISPIVAMSFFIGTQHLYGQATSDAPWIDIAFSPNVAAVIVAASEEMQSEEEKDRAAGILLFRDRRFVLEDDGRIHRTDRDVYVVLTPRGVQGASSVQAEWEPWHQHRPSIRARVITPDGTEHHLDPETITESPASEGEFATYGDSIVLNAPLPSLTPGAIVEQEITVAEKTAVFDRGTVTQVYLGGAWPIRRTRVQIQAAASIPLRFKTRLLPHIEIERLEREGQVFLTFENGPLAPLEDFDPLLPRDIPQWPYLAFSTGESWAEVAAGYSKVVDAQLDIEAVEEITTETLRGSTTREGIAEKLLRRVHRDVRYTGVFLGDAAIVPRSPRETLQRGYGDCKDQAAVLIAMFRSAGIEAYMALLNAGFGSEVETNLPGLGVFNHAIVYVPGTPPLWIDPTDKFSRMGQLHLSSQGRLTLIAGPGTTNLVRSPESPSADNRIIESREVILAEEGPGRVVETTDYWGAEESVMRRMYSQMNSTEIHEIVENYAKESYFARTIENLEYTDPEDWSQPFRIRFEAVDAEIAFADQGEGVVGIALQPLVGALSHIPAGERTDGLFLPKPFVTEWRYTIVLPPGFRPRSLPVPETVYFGPAFLTKDFSVTPDSVIATFRLDTTKRRFTAEESKELMNGIEELANSEPLLVFVDQIGEEHLIAGRVGEALAEFRRLAALHPDEAIHRTQIARALLTGGMGQAALEEAHRAVVLQPTATAYRTLGWILQHDMVGRRFKHGSDLEAAEAAYRKALEIDPSDTVARADLAILLEHDDQGVRYSAGADLGEAIKEYELLLEEPDPSNPINQNLLVALMFAGRFEELKARIGDPQESPALFLVATAAADGPEPAVREASRMFPSAEERHPVLLEAGYQLAQLRLYPEAATLLNAAAKGAPNPAGVLGRASMMSMVRRHEDLSFPNTDPVAVVKLFFVYAFLSIDQSISLLTKNAREALLADQEGLSQFKAGFRFLRSQLEKQGMPPELVVDLALAIGQWDVDGEESTGYRVRSQIPYLAEDTESVSFVVVEGDGHRILAIDDSLEEIGRVALESAVAGNLPAARTWLDWALEEAPASRDDDPLGGLPFTRFWIKGAEADESQIRYAAASLMAGSTLAAERAVPILEQGRKSASGNDLVDFDSALALAFMTLEQYEDGLEVTERLLEVHPESVVAFALNSLALEKLRRWEDLRNAAEERLGRIPDDATAFRVLIDLAAREGDFERAEELDMRLAESRQAEAADLNNRAWRAQFRAPFREEALEEAERAVSLTRNADPFSLHTLACIYSEIGRPSDALGVIMQSLEAAAKEEPKSDDWYVFGRIAEQYGELDSAIAAYRKVDAPNPDEDSKQATYYLARNRIRALEAARLN